MLSRPIIWWEWKDLHLLTFKERFYRPSSLSNLTALPNGSGGRFRPYIQLVNSQRSLLFDYTRINSSVLSTSYSWHKQRTQPNRALLMLPAVDRTTETGNLDAGVGFEHHDL